jgi:flagellar biosynthesis/type III secretory pathway protein FliH
MAAGREKGLKAGKKTGMVKGREKGNKKGQKKEILLMAPSPSFVTIFSMLTNLS